MKTKLTYAQIVQLFLKKEVGESHNLTSTGEKLISYKTVIAQWIKGKLIVNDSRYSPSTSKVQSCLRRAHHETEIQIVTGVKTDDFDLTPYLVNQ